VIASASRAYFTTDLTDPGGTAQWARGTVRWTYGDNTGQEQEVTSVDFATGVVILAVSAGFTPAPGDSFVLLPGCDLSPAQCKLYGRYVDSFGGFEFVPGQDFISQTPDVKA
jgi:hypothetical protein